MSRLINCMMYHSKNKLFNNLFFTALRCQEIPFPPKSSGLVYKPDPKNPLPASGKIDITHDKHLLISANFYRITG